MQPKILLLKEGVEESQGTGHLLANITACQMVADAIRTTLGPRGMDKVIIQGEDRMTISNDGATILKLLDIVHPASALLVDIAKSQDAEIGDGTTTVTLLAAEFLKVARPFIEEGVHVQVIIRHFRRACQMATDIVRELAYNVGDKDEIERRSLLSKVAMTAMNSKLIAPCKEYFSKMVVDAVMTLDDDVREEMLGIKQVTGGAMEDSFLVRGVAFKKTFSYAGFEQQPKHFTDPKVLLLNVELELKNENTKAELRISDPKQYQSFVDAEWKLIFDKLQAAVDTGAHIVLSRLAIGDVATQFFADRGIFCAGRVPQEDLARVAVATGARVQTSTAGLKADVLGTCGLFEEVQLGSERYNVFTGCPLAKTCTIVLRGGAPQFLEEAERSLHDAIMVVRRSRKHSSVLGGAGAIEMEISKRLREKALEIKGAGQLIVQAFAEALEVIPRQLAQNAGFDPTDAVTLLRREHHLGKTWAGVNINEEGTVDAFESCIWEPAAMKVNALNGATEAACIVLGVDETIKNKQSEAPNPGPAMRGRGGMAMRGRGGMPARGGGGRGRRR